MIEAEFGNFRQARAGVEEALVGARGKEAKVIAALTLARSGEIKRAGNVADELATQYPTDSVLNAAWLPSIRAAYQDFLVLWKNADPESPFLKEAKAELARRR